MAAQRIVCAAVRGADGELFLGARHINALIRYRKVHKDGPDPEEGFIDSREVFHSRRSAYRHAKASGQLLPREGVKQYAGEELFSEDLY